MSVAGVKTLLVDQNAAPPSCGHADGLDRRSFEILDMFDLGRTIWQEAHQTIEVSYWVCIEYLKLLAYSSYGSLSTWRHPKLASFCR